MNTCILQRHETRVLMIKNTRIIFLSSKTDNIFRHNMRNDHLRS